MMISQLVKELSHWQMFGRLSSTSEK